MTNYKKSLKNQEVKLTDVLIPDAKYELKKYSFFNMIGWLIIALIAICSTLLLVKSCIREPMPAVIKSHCNGCANT